MLKETRAGPHSYRYQASRGLGAVPACRGSCRCESREPGKRGLRGEPCLRAERGGQLVSSPCSFCPVPWGARRDRGALPLTVLTSAARDAAPNALQAERAAISTLRTARSQGHSAAK